MDTHAHPTHNTSLMYNFMFVSMREYEIVFSTQQKVNECTGDT